MIIRYALSKYKFSSAVVAKRFTPSFSLPIEISYFIQQCKQYIQLDKEREEHVRKDKELFFLRNDKDLGPLFQAMHGSRQFLRGPNYKAAVLPTIHRAGYLDRLRCSGLLGHLSRQLLVYRPWQAYSFGNATSHITVV